jgi:hypothetical protein
VTVNIHRNSVGSTVNKKGAFEVHLAERSWPVNYLASVTQGAYIGIGLKL